MLIEAVLAQNDEFDTHDVIRFLYTHHQHDYLAELNEHSNKRYPFTLLSGYNSNNDNWLQFSMFSVFPPTSKNT